MLDAGGSPVSGPTLQAAQSAGGRFELRRLQLRQRGCSRRSAWGRSSERADPASLPTLSPTGTLDRIRCLGVTEFGQSSDLTDAYALHGVDVASTIDAAFTLTGR